MATNSNLDRSAAKAIAQVSCRSGRATEPRSPGAGPASSTRNSCQSVLRCGAVQSLLQFAALRSPALASLRSRKNPSSERGRIDDLQPLLSLSSGGSRTQTSTIALLGRPSPSDSSRPSCCARSAGTQRSRTCQFPALHLAPVDAIGPRPTIRLVCVVKGNLARDSSISANAFSKAEHLFSPRRKLEYAPTRGRPNDSEVAAAAMSEVVNVDEYEGLAKSRMPKMAFDFFANGSEDQVSLRENRAALARIQLRPRVLVDVSNIDLTTTVLGFKIAMPVMVAPTALHKLAHPQGELATARAASTANTLMILSSSSSCSIEEVAATGPGVRFFQLYVYKDRNIARTLVRRAEQAGYKAIVLTVDTPRLGRREADIKNGFKLPPHLKYKNLEGLMNLQQMDKTSKSELASWADSHLDRSLNWKDVEWLRTITKLPVLVKGILTAEDAALAVQTGVAGIMVSNHGARQLDHVPATISVLEEVVKAVAGRVPVFLDGGIRRGTDVFKALALGASGVFVGRPIPFALAVDGEAGCRKALQMLRDELELTMALMGVCSVNDIRRQHVRTEEDALRPLVQSRL